MKTVRPRRHRRRPISWVAASSVALLVASTKAYSTSWRHNRRQHSTALFNVKKEAATAGIDGEEGSRNNNDAAAALGATVLHTIQDRFVEKHVRNGTLTPKTIRVASSPTNTAVRSVASTMGQEDDGSSQRAPASRPRRGRRRPPIPHHPRNVRNSTEEDRSRRILSFNRQAE